VTDLTRLCFLLLALQLAACAMPVQPVEPEPSPAPMPSIESAAEETPAAVPAAEPPLPDLSSLRISIASVGDMMIGTDYPQNHLPDDDGVSFLSNVTAVLSAADVTFGNLEGVLLDGGTPGKKCSNPAACYLFRSPTRYAGHYKRAGFDVLSLTTACITRDGRVTLPASPFATLVLPSWRSQSQKTPT